MAELQWQLMLVFTTKTMMKKTIEIGKPFIHSYLASRSARDAGEEVRRCVPAQTLAPGLCRPECRELVFRMLAVASDMLFCIQILIK